MKSITILGGDADGNLGDRAILVAMCHSFREIAPELRIFVVTRKAERVRRVLGCEAISPGPRGFFALCRAVRRSSLVVVGGGGLFQDDDSLIKMPYWALRVLLIRLLNRPVVGYSLGVGPLSSRWGRACARLAFALMRDVTVRDPHAQRVAQALSARPVRVVPDPAVTLSPTVPALGKERLVAAGVPLGRQPIIGVALRRWFPPRPRLIPHRLAYRLGLPNPQAGPEGEQLLSLIARALDAMVERRDAFVLFLPSYPVAHEADDRLCGDVFARMRRPSGAVLLIDDPVHYMACCGELSALLGGRMHPMILTAAMGTPVVGLAYNPKFYGFLAMLGEPARCLDVAEFVRGGDPAPLERLLDEAIGSPRCPTISTHPLAARVRAFDAELLSGFA